MRKETEMQFRYYACWDNERPLAEEDFAGYGKIWK